MIFYAKRKFEALEWSSVQHNKSNCGRQPTPNNNNIVGIHVCQEVVAQGCAAPFQRKFQNRIKKILFFSSNFIFLLLGFLLFFKKFFFSEFGLYFVQHKLQHGGLQGNELDPRIVIHYGIPSTASVLAFDPIQRLLAIGTLSVLSLSLILLLIVIVFYWLGMLQYF